MQRYDIIFRNKKRECKNHTFLGSPFPKGQQVRYALQCYSRKSHPAHSL